MNARTVLIGLVGDFQPSSVSHLATQDGLIHASDRLGIPVAFRWVPTPSLEAEAAATLSGFDGLLIAPGSPYVSMEGALNAITYARTRRVPLLGTCGGFQHVVIEYARRVLGFQDAQHAEYDPYGSRLFISALPCSLVGRRLEIEVAADSRAAQAYGTLVASEQYRCNFGLNPDYLSTLVAGEVKEMASPIKDEASGP